MLKLFGRASRNARTSTTIPTSTRSFPIRQFIIPPLVRPLRPISSYVTASRAFSTSKPSFKGLSPESENPTPKEAEPHNATAGPADLSIEKFHDLADEYMNALIEKLEQLQEEDEDVDCEYSVCPCPSLPTSPSIQ
jgi:frataxin